MHQYNDPGWYIFMDHIHHKFSYSETYYSQSFIGLAETYKLCKITEI